LWPEIELAYSWVHRAAHILNNEQGHDVLLIRQEYRGLLAEMAAGRSELGCLAGAVGHFRKVTKSYWGHLFTCDEHPAIPQTNNDLEQCFGSVRYAERRASGREGGAPGLVVRGRVRLLAAVVSRTVPLGAAELAPRDLARWRELRTELAYRQEGRRRQLRFRRDPAAYLSQLEEQLLQTSLPA